MAHKRHMIFRFLYRSAYLLLYVLLFALLVVTPGDIIVRSFRNKQTYNVWILAVTFFATILIVGFIYALRLYVNKTILDAIPKTWVPIERSDMNKAVYKMIQAGLSRSAAVAYEARPRVQPREEELPDKTPCQAPTTPVRVEKFKRGTEELTVTLPPPRPVWKDIEHPGWASPNSPDLPNLQYSTVLSELPHLIEAKALTLAPPDPTSRSDPPMLDPEAVALLQRQPSVSLREYLDHLGSLAVLEPGATVTDFLTQYEHARFSNRPISNARFRQLMHLFAAILRSMQPLDLDALDALDGDEDDDGGYTPSESDIDNDGPAETIPSSPGGTLSRSVTLSTQGSTRRPVRNLSASPWPQYRTAPTTPRSRRAGADTLSRKSSNSSFARTREQFPAHQSSSSSLRSRYTNDSGSIIRLATQEDTEDLPFVLTLRDTAGSVIY